MEVVKAILSVSVLAGWVCSAALAGTTWAPPTTSLPQVSVPSDLQRDLAGVPDNVKQLILTFEQVRESYLQRQYFLLTELRSASTPDQIDQIREQLQDNRQAFLTDSKTYLEELRNDLQALKSKISHAEFIRVINAAHSAGAGTGHRRRG